jgi:hypothetical protein
VNNSEIKFALLASRACGPVLPFRDLFTASRELFLQANSNETTQNPQETHCVRVAARWLNSIHILQTRQTVRGSVPGKRHARETWKIQGNHSIAMKFTLHLKQNHPFAGNPCIVEMEAERILCNDVTLPTETKSSVRLWVAGNEYGALGAVWADCEQDALDELVDAGLGDGLLIDEKDVNEETTRLGNASKPCNLDNAWLAPVQWDYTRDIILLLKLAEAKGSNADTLADI